MPIDSNIALGVQAPQFANPLDIAAKAQNLRALTMQNDDTQRKDNQALALSDLIRQNTSVDQNGVAKVNMSNFTSQGMAPGAQANPQDVMAYALQKHNNDLDALKKTTEAANGIATSVLPDGSNWAQQRQKAIDLGLPNAQSLPQNFDKNFVDNWQMHTLNGDQYIKALDTEAKMADTKENTASRLATAATNKQNQAVAQTSTALESAKGAGDVQQALKDKYAAKKFDSLVGLYGDPNKLDPQQVQLAATEVAKIASGGIPTAHELQGLNPSTIPSALASAAQIVTDKPTPANKGAFVNAMRDYVGALKKDAIGTVKDKYTRVLNTRRGSLGDDNYNNFKSQYIDPLNAELTAGKPQTIQQGQHTYNLNPETGEYE